MMRVLTPRLRAMIRKEFLQLLRDKRLLPVVLVIPIVQLVMFGYAVSTDIKHLPTAIIDQDRTALSRRLVEGFGNSEYFDIKARPGGESRTRVLMDRGDVSVALVIPRGFMDRVTKGRQSPVQLLVDGSLSNSSSVALAYSQQIVGRLSQELAFKRLASLGNGQIRLARLEARTRIWYNPTFKSVDYMIPGLCGLILMISTMALTSQAVVREREEGTLEQLIVTPILRREFLLGKTLPFVLIGLIQATSVFIGGIVLFGVPLRGSVLLLYFASLLFVFTSLGMGLLVSTVSRTRQQAMVTSMFFMLPAQMFSGMIFPIENMPAVARLVTYAVPLRYFIVILRGITLKGVGLGPLWGQLVAMTFLGVAIMGASALRFQKKFSD